LESGDWRKLGDSGEGRQEGVAEEGLGLAFFTILSGRAGKGRGGGRSSRRAGRRAAAEGR